MMKLPFALVVVPTMFARGQSISGNWTGELTAGTITLHFRVHLAGTAGT